LAKKLEKVEAIDDVKTILESALFRLQNQGPGSDESATNGTINQEAEDTGAAAAAVNGNTSADATQRARSPSPQATSKLKVVFDERLGREKDRGKLVRYQINPRANWGPMNRAGKSA